MIPRELVIARYQEPLDWLRRIPSSWKITIYNKGGPLKYPAIPLPNIGQEAHTYLYHLVSRRNSLARQTVFLQGYPFDHVPSLHRILTAWTAENLPPGPFDWLGFFIDWDDPEGHRLFVPWRKNPERHTLPTRSLYRQLFDQSAPNQLVFFGGAQFSLSSELALRRPPSFYIRALNLAATWPNAAHCFERIWDRVFGVNGIPEPFRKGPFPVYFKKVRRLETAAANQP